MARGDLAGGAGGGIDSKFSSATHIADGAIFARGGPTSDDQPPFCWTEEFARPTSATRSASISRGASIAAP